MDAYKIELTPDDNGTFLVVCPAFDDVATDTERVEEAPARARLALLAAIDARMDRRIDIPEPEDLAGYDGPAVILPVIAALKVRLYRAMEAAGITRTELASRLGVDPVQVRRLLDVTTSARLESMEAAFAALGGTLDIAVRLPKAA